MKPTRLFISSEQKFVLKTRYFLKFIKFNPVFAYKTKKTMWIELINKFVVIRVQSSLITP